MGTEENKNDVGRPPAFKTSKELQKKIDNYFRNCPDKKQIVVKKTNEVIEIPTPTICGLCHYLGFESRQSFYDYEKNEKFSYTIKRARLFIEKEYEQLLQTSNYPGAIFALKNFGWVDKTEQEITGTQIQKIFITPQEKASTDKHIDEIINS